MVKRFEWDEDEGGWCSLGDGETFAPQEQLVRASDYDALEAVLRSIAANTCCDRCQEAALVARTSLETACDHNVVQSAHVRNGDYRRTWCAKCGATLPNRLSETRCDHFWVKKGWLQCEKCGASQASFHVPPSTSGADK